MRIQQRVQIKESSWRDVASKRRKQEKGEDRTEMQKDAVHLAEWVGVDHREKIHDFRYLLWNRAEIEEGGYGGAVQKRIHGRMEICSQCSKNH